MRKKTWCILIGILLLSVAGYKFFGQLNDYCESSNLYEDTVTQYVSVSKDMNSVINETNWAELIDVDIPDLKKINNDIVGWIYFENEDISYPILYSGDDDKYLRKAYTGKDVMAGSIFMEGNNSSDFSDAHTIIYGHNMKDLSMFGKLRYYASDKNYISNHEYFQIITEEKKYRYRIISYKVVSEDSDVYTVFKNGGREFEMFVRNVLQKGSYLNNTEVIDSMDHLITLSTCSDDNRFVVSAVRCDERNVENNSL